MPGDSGLGAEAIHATGSPRGRNARVRRPAANLGLDESRLWMWAFGSCHRSHAPLSAGIRTLALPYYLGLWLRRLRGCGVDFLPGRIEAFPRRLVSGYGVGWAGTTGT